MKLCLTIAIFTYLVGDSVQFQQQFDQIQLPTNQENQFVPWQQQFMIPAKRHVQQPIPEYGAGAQFEQQPQLQQQLPDHGSRGQFQQELASFQQQIPGGGAKGQFQGQGEQQVHQNLVGYDTRIPSCGLYSQPPCPPSNKNPTPKHDGIGCEGRVDESGAYTFTCSGPKQVIENKNVLWLETPDINQTVHIEVPNYEIKELIQAGFKGTGTGRTKINVVLQPPTYNVEAQRDKAVIKPSKPDVWFKYLKAKGEDLHWPNDRAYQPIQLPIRPPPNDGQFNSGPGQNPGTYGAPPQRRFAPFPVTY